jgi:hypothetical protein
MHQAPLARLRERGGGEGMTEYVYHHNLAREAAMSPSPLAFYIELS